MNGWSGTRREFGQITLGGLAAAMAGTRLLAIDSTIGGVKIGAISYCFRSIPRPANGDYMPQFSDLSDQQIAAIVTWIHYARQQGRYQELTAEPIRSGDAAAGKTYFERSCSTCHAVDRDLAGIGRKYDGAALRAATLAPKSLKVERSFTAVRLQDTKLASAEQRHHTLLENYSAEEVANLVVYLASVR